MAGADLTAARLRELLTYDPDTGLLHWRKPPSKKTPDGAAGHFDKQGYRRLRVDGRNYFAHRLVWLYVYGEWPALEIDHMNAEKADNRIANLRDVSNVVNHENLKRATRASGTGYLGVWRHSNGKFRASIKVAGKRRHLAGTFDSPESAHLAYIEAKRQLHAGCTI